MAVGLLLAACGGGTTNGSAPTSSTRPAQLGSAEMAVTAGRLTFTVPSSWTVGYGECRCGWGTPDSATLGNGHLAPGVLCSCPAEAADAPSGLHLYEGTGGLTSGGSPTRIHGVAARVELDTATAGLTVTFPGLDQWITVGPAPTGDAATTRGQVQVERQILASVRPAPGA